MDDNELKKIIDYAHSIKKKVYVCSSLLKTQQKANML